MKKGKIFVNVDDVVGKSLGKIKVVSYEGSKYIHTKGGDRLRHFYNVICECGNTNIVQRGPILNNIVHSCGCGRRAKYGNTNEE